MLFTQNTVREVTPSAPQEAEDEEVGTGRDGMFLHPLDVAAATSFRGGQDEGCGQG
jgi:hypothetical protein